MASKYLKASNTCYKNGVMLTGTAWGAILPFKEAAASLCLCFLGALRQHWDTRLLLPGTPESPALTCASGHSHGTEVTQQTPCRGWMQSPPHSHHVPCPQGSHALQGPLSPQPTLEDSRDMAGHRWGSSLRHDSGDTRDKAVTGTPSPGLVLGLEPTWSPGGSPREAAQGWGDTQGSWRHVQHSTVPTLPAGVPWQVNAIQRAMGCLWCSWPGEWDPSSWCLHYVKWLLVPSGRSGWLDSKLSAPCTHAHPGQHDVGQGKQSVLNPVKSELPALTSSPFCAYTKSPPHSAKPNQSLYW